MVQGQHDVLIEEKRKMEEELERRCDEMRGLVGVVEREAVVTAGEVERELVGREEDARAMVAEMEGVRGELEGAREGDGSSWCIIERAARGDGEGV